jgi:flagella basal body P-ring formation protein FlgA
VLDREFIHERVKEFLENKFPNRLINIDELTVRGMKTYPSGLVDLKINSKKPINRHGRLSLTIDVLVDGGCQGRVRISGNVSEYVNIVCASQDLKKGKIILATDLTLQRKNVFNLSQIPLEHRKLALGKMLKVSVRAGMPIESSMFQEVPTVEKGNIVTLLVKKNKLCIKTIGMVKEDGYENKLVAVENISSGKTLRGVVKDESTIEVVY